MCSSSLGGANLGEWISISGLWHTFKLLFWNGCPKIDFCPIRVDIGVPDTQVPRNSKTICMGPVPGVEIQIFRNKKFEHFNRCSFFSSIEHV